MRDELFNGERFHSVTEARVVIGEWVEATTTPARTGVWACAARADSPPTTADQADSGSIEGSP